MKRIYHEVKDPMYIDIRPYINQHPHHLLVTTFRGRSSSRQCRECSPRWKLQVSPFLDTSCGYPSHSYIFVYAGSPKPKGVTKPLHRWQPMPHLIVATKVLFKCEKGGWNNPMAPSHRPLQGGELPLLHMRQVSTY